MYITYINISYNILYIYIYKTLCIGWSNNKTYKCAISGITMSWITNWIQRSGPGSHA